MSEKLSSIDFIEKRLKELEEKFQKRFKRLEADLKKKVNEDEFKKMFEQEKLLRFVKKLHILVREFKENIARSGYGYSLPTSALRIANDKAVIDRTSAWKNSLTRLSNDLDEQSLNLYEKIEKCVKTEEGSKFVELFEDFRGLLASLRDFKNEFYNMINETKTIKNFSQEEDFLKQYTRCREEYNDYMNRIRIFSDDVKAEFDRWFARDLIEHLKDLHELYKS
jgi:hypothetical protein